MPRRILKKDKFAKRSPIKRHINKENVLLILPMKTDTPETWAVGQEYIMGKNSVRKRKQHRNGEK